MNVKGQLGYKSVVITLSNGHKFKFMTASGALAFDGRGWPWEKPLGWVGLLDPTLFTNVTKTLTRSPKRGNLRWSHPWSVVKKLSGGGIVNAIGLTNPGIDWWIEKVAPTISEVLHLIVSIEANDERMTADMIQMLQGMPFIFGIELNLSCPNTKDITDQTTERILTICRHAAKVSKIPLIAKLSYTHDYGVVAQELEKENKIQALSINSLPWSFLYPGRRSPLEKFGGGGVSGRIIQSYTWKMVEDLAKASKIPVIGPSVWNYRDLQTVTDKGAKAVSFGSIFVRYPWRPTLFVRRWIKEHYEG